MLLTASLPFASPSRRALCVRARTLALFLTAMLAALPAMAATVGAVVMAARGVMAAPGALAATVRAETVATPPRSLLLRARPCKCRLRRKLPVPAAVLVVAAQGVPVVKAA